MMNIQTESEPAWQRWLLRALHIVLAALLLYCAWLQVNDPDPAFWVLMYVICALVPLARLAGRHYRYLNWLGMLFCAVAIGLTLTGAWEYLDHMDREPLMQAMNDQKPYIEEAREWIGAAIALVVVAGYELANKMTQAGDTNDQ